MIYFLNIRRDTDVGGPEGKVARELFQIAESKTTQGFTEDELRKLLKMPSSEVEVMNKLAEYGFTAEVLSR